MPDDSELNDLTPKRLLGLLDDIVDFEGDEKYKDDEKGKRKDHEGDD